MSSGREGRDRRYRPAGDLSVFELAPLLGAGASAMQLRATRRTLANGYALECLEQEGWRVVGWTGDEARAREWVEHAGLDDLPIRPGRV